MYLLTRVRNICEIPNQIFSIVVYLIFPSSILTPALKVTFMKSHTPVLHCACPNCSFHSSCQGQLSQWRERIGICVTGVQVPRRAGIFHFSRPSPGPTQPHIQWVRGAETEGIMWPDSKTDHSASPHVYAFRVCNFRSRPNLNTEIF
jgi:hypothetical protein